MPLDLDWFAPRYAIKVAGTRLEDDVTRFVSSITYAESDELAARLTIVLDNQNFTLSGYKAFAVGNEVDLWMGYGGRLEFQNRTIITSVRPTFPRGNRMPSITVEAQGAETRLFEDSAKGEVFSKTTDARIVEKVLRRVGVETVSLDTGRRVTRWRKKGTNSWRFLRRLARLNGYDLAIRYSPTSRLYTAYFGPAGEGEDYARYDFVYGTSDGFATVLEAEPRYDLPSQATKLEVSYTDPRTRRTNRVSVEVKRKSAERTKFVGPSGRRRLKEPVANGPTVKLTVFGQSEEVVADRPFRSVGDVKRFARAWFERRARDFVFMNATLLGTPALRKRQTHGFAFPDPQFSGDWILTSTEQRMSGSGLYETGITATKKVLDDAASTLKVTPQ